MNISDLKTIKNYANLRHFTSSYIYKLIKEGKMEPVIIDDVKFIDIAVYPIIPNK